MATKTAGGQTTHAKSLGLTFEAQVAMEVGDGVRITGPYECNKPDGVAAIIGVVKVANKKHSGGVFPSAQVPGDVTVEVRGYTVETLKSAVAITAGAEVGYNAANELRPVAAGVIKVGVALTSTTGANQDIDVLLQ